MPEATKNTRQHLRIVEINDETGEAHEIDQCPTCRDKDETIAGLERNIRSLVVKLGRAERQLEQARGDEPEAKTIKAILRHWQVACNHEGCKIPSGGVRWEKCRARLKDGFTQAQLIQAINGAAMFPYTSKGSEMPGMRSRTGKTRYDDITTIFKSETTVENLIACAEIGTADTSADTEAVHVEYNGHTSADTGALVERLKNARLYRADESESLGQHMADCPICGFGMVVQKGAMRCYGGHLNGEIKAALEGRKPMGIDKFL